MSTSPIPGAWICVDGVEGTGKSTITNALADLLPVVKAPEFSTAPFGHALRAAVRATPHHISTSPLGQSLVFLGDFLEVHASNVAPLLASGGTVYLTAPERLVRERLLRRDGHCGPARLAFIRRAADAAGHYLSRDPELISVTVDTNPPLEDVVRTVEGVVRQYVRRHSS